MLSRRSRMVSSVLLLWSSSSSALVEVTPGAVLFHRRTPNAPEGRSRCRSRSSAPGHLRVVPYGAGFLCLEVAYIGGKDTYGDRRPIRTYGKGGEGPNAPVQRPSTQSTGNTPETVNIARHDWNRDSTTVQQSQGIRSSDLRRLDNRNRLDMLRHRKRSNALRECSANLHRVQRAVTRERADHTT